MQSTEFIDDLVSLPAMQCVVTRHNHEQMSPSETTHPTNAGCLQAHGEGGAVLAISQRPGMNGVLWHEEVSTPKLNGQEKHVNRQPAPAGDRSQGQGRTGCHQAQALQLQQQKYQKGPEQSPARDRVTSSQERATP